MIIPFGHRKVYILRVPNKCMKKQTKECPHCKSKDTVKRGYFQTESKGKQQRYFCNSCKRKFIIQDAFYRMRNSKKKISLCLDLFFRGLSTREIQSHLKAFYPHNSDHSNILRWVRKYSMKISEYTDNLKLNTGSYVEMDEMEYHRRKSHKAKRGIDENWFIDVICPETKFMIASSYCKSRRQRDVKRILNEVKEKTNNLKVITTDGWLAYPKAIRQTFGISNKTHQLNVIHNQKNASKGDGFNYPIERLHNNIRARTKTFRGFHGSLSSANSIMKGYEIFYNYIRKHQAIGKTPSELATNIKFENPNRWLELIKMSH